VIAAELTGDNFHHNGGLEFRQRKTQIRKEEAEPVRHYGSLMLPFPLV
jgi:hypothetical protein